METAKLPKIYSKNAIFGFSIAMSALFGGVLLFINLRDLGKKKEANLVLLFSVLFTALSVYIVNLPQSRSSSLAYICGAAGGCVYNYFFIPKYIPNAEAYPKKPIWIPVVIALVIVAVFVSIMIFSNAQNV